MLGVGLVGERGSMGKGHGGREKGYERRGTGEGLKRREGGRRRGDGEKGKGKGKGKGEGDKVRQSERQT